LQMGAPMGQWISAIPYPKLIWFFTIGTPKHLFLTNFCYILKKFIRLDLLGDNLR